MSEKKFTQRDVEILGQQEIRRRKTLPVCKSCFLRTEHGLNEEGLCRDCKKEQEVFISRSEYDPTYPVVADRSFGPLHSPTYLASCRATGLEHPTNKSLPHPNALGNLPINHTDADFEHYVTARGGYLTGPKTGYIDARTAEQRDPNHRLYSATPLMTQVFSDSTYASNLPKEAIETANPGPKVFEKQGPMPAAGMPKIYYHTYTLNPEGNTFKDYRKNQIDKIANSMSPEERHEHMTMHIQKTRSYPQTTDAKGNFWLGKPDTCALCHIDQQINEATHEHPNHGINADNPLCQKC